MMVLRPPHLSIVWSTVSIRRQGRRGGSFCRCRRFIRMRCGRGVGLVGVIRWPHRWPALWKQFVRPQAVVRPQVQAVVREMEAVLHLFHPEQPTLLALRVVALRLVAWSILWGRPASAPTKCNITN